MGGNNVKARTMEAEVKAVASQSLGPMSVEGRYHKLPHLLTDKYNVESKALGTGYSGAVMLAHDKATGGKHAVKAFKLMGLTKDKKQELVSEVQIFLMMDHPHVARLVDVYEGSDELSLVMECMEGGELFDRVSERKIFREKDANEATHQMLLAVNYLHGMDVVHRDLKLENFLYEKKDTSFLKLIDFGFSKIWDKDTKMELSCGTLSYVAPEVLAKSYTSQCDMWSLGVIVFILLAGYMPFSGTSERQQIAAIKSGKFSYRKDRWAKVPQVAYEFVQGLLVASAESRMTASQALAHPWMEKRRQDDERRPSVVDNNMFDALTSFATESQFRRNVMQVMAWSLTLEERSQVRKAFLELDSGSTGTITLLEMKGVLEGQFSIPNEQISHIFKALDSNNDGIICYSEFLAAMMSTRLRMHDNLLAATFRRFDKDGTGTICWEDFKIVLGEGSDIDAVMKQVDRNADGRVSYEEFIAFLHQTDGEEMAGIHNVANQVIDKELQNRRKRGSLDLPARGTDDDLESREARKRERLKFLAFKLMGGF